MESSRTCPWPRGSLRTHFQVLGLGLGLMKFSMTHICTDIAAKKVLIIRRSFPSCRDVTTLVVRFCHKSGVPARALCHDFPPQGKVAIWHRLLGLCCMSLALALWLVACVLGLGLESQVLVLGLGLVAYVLGLGLAISVLDSITGGGIFSDKFSPDSDGEIILKIG